MTGNRRLLPKPDSIRRNGLRRGSLALLLLLFASESALNAAEGTLPGGARWTDLPMILPGRTGFSSAAPAFTGLTVTNVLDDRSAAANRVLENGSGIAIGDYDADGRPDLFLCSALGPGRLYRNLGGWRFEERTTQAGLAVLEPGPRGAVFADINGDGRLDLLVSTLSTGVRCFLNMGQGTFQESTETAGTRALMGATTLALADVDGNGTLDLYVAAYRPDDVRDNSLVEVRMVNGAPQFHPKYGGRLFVTPEGMRERGDADVLYLNDGTGHFGPVSWTAGAFLDEDGKALAEAPRDWGLSAAFHDVNGDGAPDLYVCNDYWSPDRFWMNDGHGRFRAISRLALRHTGENSMGVDFADLDGDGRTDLFVLDMLSRDPRLRRRQSLAQTPVARRPGDFDSRPQFNQNSLFYQRGDGTFAEIANYAGLQATGWSWQPLFMDIDLDGWPDVLVPSGHRRDVQDLDATERIRALQHPWPRDLPPAQRQEQFTRELMEHGRLYPSLAQPILAFRNLGNLRFEDTTSVWGTGELGVHQGIATGDLDGDGDLDFVVNNLNGRPSVFRNDATAPRIVVQLRGSPPNTEGIGAVVRLRGGAIPIQTQEIVCGGKYLSGSEAIAVFAAGSSRSNLVLEVDWRGGRKTRVEGVVPNRRYQIFEAEAGLTPKTPSPTSSPPWFADQSALLHHVHHDEPPDDFQRQPLLPRRLSQLGPGVAWCDVNQDGYDDLIIGSGNRGTLGWFLNDRKGGFESVQKARLNSVVQGGTTGIVGLAFDATSREVLTGLAPPEGTRSNTPLAASWTFSTDSMQPVLASADSSAGPLAVADFDGDGDLDLFVGSRWIPGRFPESGSSHLVRQEAGKWVLDADAERTLASVGMVSGAVWSDLDGDGAVELILACDWGPLRIFRAQQGKLVEWNPSLRGASLTKGSLTLHDLGGLWNGVSTGDLDGDGRLDIVASNWGWNSALQASVAQPLALYSGDFLNRGTIDLIETEFDPIRRELAPRHGLQLLGNALPVLHERFPSHRAFSEASLGDVLVALSGSSRRFEITTLASTVFLNRGDYFEVMELPAAAQWSPAFAVVVSDFNGDGVEDVFLSQNFFALPASQPRLDAGFGLMLRGDGRGGLVPLQPNESGITVPGEQRGAAASDFDHDGRVDLVVTQNAGATYLYHNTQARPGIRVRLSGSLGNPDGVGATLRLRSARGLGPAREVHAGSGYWSQDGVVQVLSCPDLPTGVWVRWPGGKEQSYALEKGVTEVVLKPDGTLTSSTR